MRYYAIRILDQAGNLKVPDPVTRKFVTDNSAAATYTSHIGSQMIPGALNIELDVPESTFAYPAGGAHVRVWGVSLTELSQASDLAYYSIEVLAGMVGEPDINRNTKAGQILQGMILQSYGNWTGVDQHLDMVVHAGATIPIENAKIVFNWPSGQALGDAIQQALEASYPSYSVEVNVSTIKQTHDEAGTYRSIHSFAKQILEQTQGYFDSTYPGVSIKAAGQTIYVYDSASGANDQGNPIQIAFEDLIGQPVWIQPFTLAFQCPMRADIPLGAWVKMPSGLYPPYVQSTAGAAYPNAGPSIKSAFDGSFMVTHVHHFGNYRQADARSWNTTYRAVFPDRTFQPLPDIAALPPGLV